MPVFAAMLTCVKPLKATTVSCRADRRGMRVSCAALPEENPSRRAIFTSLAGSLAVTPLLCTTAFPAQAKDQIIKADSLSSFQRRDLYADFQARAQAEIAKVTTSKDAPLAVRLLLNDAATYDAASKTGGVNGSVVLSEELNRPENKDLKDLVDRLGAARKSLAANGPKTQKMLSWADTIVIACKVTNEALWREDKLLKNPKNGEYLVNNFKNPIPIRLGRLDATSPDNASQGLVLPANATPAQVLDLSKKLGVKDPQEYEGPFARRRPFWERVMFVLWTATQPDQTAAENALAEGAPEAFAEYKDKYQASKSTTFRQDYEIDFGEFLGRLADLGAKFDPNAYVYDITIVVPNKL